jgi:hypothetical protein
VLAIGVPPKRPPPAIAALADHLQMTAWNNLLPCFHVVSVSRVFPSMFPTRHNQDDLVTPS